MKKNLFIVIVMFLSVSVTLSKTQQASANGLSGTGEIEFDRLDEKIAVKDPETIEDVDPGVIAKTEGSLRIDFAPQLIFETGEISNQSTSYSAQAQLFRGVKKGKGNFIQVSDYRGVPTGWSLQVRQETQFQHDKQADSQLKGAVISFDKAWLNSTLGKELAPKVSKDIIQMNNIGETYPLAEAEFDHGVGTWSVIFGASDENKNGQDNTIHPLNDKNGQPIIDSVFKNQQIYINDAINLTIPGATKKIPGTYSTVLTWIIAELP